jgi:hypothetical protein
VPADRPSLRETQLLLHGLITAPEGVRKGLAARGLDERELARVVRGDAAQSAADRLDVYANMYFFRILEVLRQDFPSVLAALGDDGFHNLVTDYLLAHPPERPSIRHVGARLPAFLDEHTSARERPWLADLARLEWARGFAFDAADAAPLTVDALRALWSSDGAGAFAALPLALVPAHAWVHARFAVDETWQSVTDGAAPIDPAPGARALLVWRRDVTVYHRAVDDLERQALVAASAGRPFGAVCELVAARVPADDAARVAFELLLRWSSDALLAA